METLRMYLEEQPLWNELVEELQVPELCNEDDSEDVGWFVPPEQHFLELLLFTLSGCSLLLWLRPRLLGGGSFLSPRAAKKQSILPTDTTFPTPGPLLRVTELLIAVLLTLSFITVVIHKSLKQNLWFLLQPCHVIHFLTIIIALLPDNSARARAIGSTIFNLLLCYYFAPILGLLFADLSCYELYWELENWFLQHALLCLVPFFWLYTRKFVVVSGMAYYCYAWSAIFIYHMTFLTPLGLWSHSNLNFTVCPPGVLKLAGVAFRWITPILMLGLLLFLRIGLIGLVCQLLGISQSTGRLTSWGFVELLIVEEHRSKNPTTQPKHSNKKRRGVKREGGTPPVQEAKSGYKQA